ncbi:RNA-binding protein 39 [Eucalyptus grandis]|uniref:RNA-binding protein 39 n=1 Tax=Eucalyptus grandis TaxID=71139 RepID=UPI00192EB65A|nr:RNA-binding protein 39 [Eucalyptus grandis]XP_039167238.1 RNA-binding protein 39 [Eucalyptus grandis]
MDFDEYEYLEKTVENPEPHKVKEAVNGGEETLNSGDRRRSRSSKHKEEENEDDADHLSKRSKSGGKPRDNDRRGSSRHRSQSRDGERDGHKSSRERKEKGRDRERDSEREDRNGGERDRDRDKRRDRDRREPDRDRVMEREQNRPRRSKSPPGRHRGGRDEMVRERIRDMEHGERDKEREFKERERETRPHKEKKEDAKEPEADPERDQRTVFAYQINLKADERDVYEFFSRAGKVRDVRLIMDRISRRSKGVGYVEFYDAMSVPMAIALSGQPLLGIPVMVKPSEAEKNLVQSTAAAAGGPGGSIGPYSGGARRLYVGNLHTNLTTEQLKKIFEPFGEVELVQLPLDESGHCKGFGFVQFARLEDARNALSLNGLEIAGRTIKVSAITDQAGTQDVGTNAGDFDDDEGGGLSLNASSRASLMLKLDRSGAASSIASSVGTSAINSAGATLPSGPILGTAPVVPPLAASLMQPNIAALTGLPGSGLQVTATTGPTIDTVGVPSECLLLKNMFDPTLETEPDFELDIKEDVQEECSKFGNLRHIFVDKNSSGFVYLRFEDTQSASNAQRALHGRWFAGKMITATFMVPLTYEAKFPDSR